MEAIEQNFKKIVHSFFVLDILFYAFYTVITEE